MLTLRANLAAYAAAASAVTSAGTAEKTTEAVSHSTFPPGGSTSTGSGVDSDLAAAWASWKQVRESLSGPELTSQLQKVVQPAPKKIREHDSATSDSGTAAAATAEENGAIALSIASSLNSSPS